MRSLKCALYGEGAAGTNVLELVAFVSMTRVSNEDELIRGHLSVKRRLRLIAMLSKHGYSSFSMLEGERLGARCSDRSNLSKKDMEHAMIMNS